MKTKAVQKGDGARSIVPRCVAAVLLGVTSQHVLEMHKAGHLPAYPNRFGDREYLLADVTALRDARAARPFPRVGRPTAMALLERSTSGRAQRQKEGAS